MQNPKSNQEKINSMINPKGIVCHTFSPDLKKIAISVKDSNVVEIYEIGDISQPNKWKLISTIKEHTHKVSAIDWSKKNLILTCSYDRNVHVWHEESPNIWQQELVVIGKNKNAILCGEWDFTGNKFAIGTGGYKVYIGEYEKDMNWWHSKQVARFKSSVITIAFHPSSRAIAIGSLDFSLKIVTCYLETIDEAQSQGIFGKINSFGEILLEIKNAGSWVEHIAWNPTGNQFAYTVHDSTIHFGNISSDDEKINEDYVFTWTGLPFTQILFINDKQLAASGYDQEISIFTHNNTEWQHLRNLDENNMSKAEYKKQKSVVSSLASQFEKGGRNVKTTSKKGPDSHQTPIIWMKKLDNMITSNDTMGNILFWKQ